MHSKQKGSIGEIATVKYLLESGFSVFGDFSDLSKIDLIAEKDNKLYRIQCKSITAKNNQVILNSRKFGPNYTFKYSSKELDIFSIYVLNLDKLLFVSARELCVQGTLTFRTSPTKNGQKKKVKFIEEYTLDRCLRDCTRCIPTGKAVDGDTVQTTTNDLASES